MSLGSLPKRVGQRDVGLNNPLDCIQMRQHDETGHRLSTETRFSGTVSEGSATAIEIPALTLLAHPDPRRVGELVTLPELGSMTPARLRRDGQPVNLSRLEPLFAAPGSGEARPLAEPHLSRKPLRLVPSGTPGEVLLARTGSPTPATIDGEPLAENRLLTASELARGAVLELGRHVVLLLHLQPPLAPPVPRYGLVGDSGAMIKLRQEIQLAARLESSVLLRGASGTGKELVARAVHDAGSRHGRPWVTVNMAAIPPSLAAAELFGAKKGAYTGADRAKRGYFIAADGGTLFLDEIGDTPADVQPLLLRGLESGEIQPVGGAETRRVDVRVIAATDADLDDAVADGRFRAPLLHRLAGWEIRLPALAERRADVGRLLVHFLDLELRELGAESLLDPPPSAPSRQRPWAPASLVARLARYDWPGNVRQLRNVTRRMAITAHADPDAPLASAVEPLLTEAAPRQDAGALSTEPAEPPAAAPVPAPEASPTGRWRPVYRKASEVGEDELIAALRAQKWDLKPAAEALGVSRSVLYQLIEKNPKVRTAAQLEGDEIKTTLAHHDGDVLAAAEDLEVSAQGLKLRMKALGLR